MVGLSAQVRGDSSWREFACGALCINGHGRGSGNSRRVDDAGGVDALVPRMAVVKGAKPECGP
jgi:hypothetical protein